MSAYPIANPDTPGNKAAVEMTQMHINEAMQLARANSLSVETLPAIILALAVNRQTIQQSTSASAAKK